ncbi:PadR family transcriptional regulator [Candidatus Contubernalis alkalaceticus]|nr:PadR family transcriptional regulator [Candidatus Contubernalis alkalaceticus]
MNNYLDKNYWSGLLKMGLSRFFILSILKSSPMHCYAIAKRINMMTSGRCSPSEGALYPVLNEFLKGGYVNCTIKKVSGRKRKIYALTMKGMEAYKTARESWQEMNRVLFKPTDSYYLFEERAGENI